MHILRPLVLSLVAVIGIFIAALWVSHARTSQIASRAHAIADTSDSEHAVRNALEIARLRGEARDLALALGSIGVVAAVASGAIAIGAIRRQARIVAEHSDLLDRRATELEAFAGRVAHDLRNPLGAIALRIESARMRGGADAATLERLSENASRMDHLIEDLLQFASAGAAPETGARSNLRNVVVDVIADLRGQADRAHAELIAEDIPAIDLACPQGALASVLSNLLSNAAKYIVGASGPRMIHVRAMPRGERMRVEVADTGPGLAPGSEQLVFEPFRRAGDPRQPGLGLGLATVKRITEAYHGYVGVTSMPGRGATFWFELPVAEAA
jgi:signal transduction histidine kinase